MTKIVVEWKKFPLNMSRIASSGWMSEAAETTKIISESSKEQDQ
jgi:hypothetical protein